MDRRTFLAGTAAAATLLRTGTAHADMAGLAAQPPPGFSPWSAPGGSCASRRAAASRPTASTPRPTTPRRCSAARSQELTGKADLVEAVKLFVHPQDKVCVKVNGIAQQNMATNKELVLPFVEAMIAAGVPAANITLLEQYPGFMQAHAHHARRTVPAGVGVELALEQRRHHGLARHPGHAAPHQVRARADRVDGAHQLRAHQGPLDPAATRARSRT